MPLTTLPHELLLSIADHVDDFKDISALSQTSRFLNSFFEPILYKRDVRRFGSLALLWGVAHQRIETVRKSLHYGADTETTFAKVLNRMYIDWLLRSGISKPDDKHTIHLFNEKSFQVQHHTFKDRRENGPLSCYKLGNIVQCTALQLAIDPAFVEIIGILLAAGAEVDKEYTNNTSQHSPLHLASSLGFWTVVEKLLEGGAEVENLDGYGNSALQYAICDIPCRRLTFQHFEIARLLLERGARPRIRVLYTNSKTNPSPPHEVLTPTTPAREEYFTDVFPIGVFPCWCGYWDQDTEHEHWRTKERLIELMDEYSELQNNRLLKFRKYDGTKPRSSSQ